MAVRIPWDKYETAILLDAGLQVKRGEVSRKTAVKTVSALLRERAICKGIEIDEVFRNENGISMQLSALMTAFDKKDGGLTVSKLFLDIIELYRSSPQEFELIVKEAKGMNEADHNIESFDSWLRSNPTYAETSDAIIMSLNMISVLCIKAGTISAPVLKIRSSEEIKRFLAALQKNRSPRIHSKKQLNSYVNAVRTYLTYLEYTDQMKMAVDESTIPEEKTEPEMTATMLVDFQDLPSFAYTRPDYYQLEGSKAVVVKNWTKLYVAIVNKLCDRDGNLLKTLIGTNISGANRIDFLPKEDSHKMTAPYLLENGIAIETNLSASDIVKKIRTLLSLYNISCDKLIIGYHKRKKQVDGGKPMNNSTVAPENSPALMYRDGITNILESYYNYGFRIGSPIELMRFRNYAEACGVSVPESDESLEQEILAAGTQIDGRVFVFGKAMVDELKSKIVSIFSTGAEVIFFEPFMEIESEWLEESHISNPDLVRELLYKHVPDLYCSQNMILQGKRKSEVEAVVSEIHRISAGQTIISFSDLCENLPYIPSEKVAWCLSASEDFVWVSEGRYFVMEHFIVDADDATAILNFVAAECNDKGFASIADLPFGNIPEQNYELSITGLYSAVYLSLLKTSYYLNGKILTREANGLDIIDLLKSFCREHERCTVQSVMDRAVELTGLPNRQNVFYALYSTMVRIDKEHFVAPSQVEFDISQIDDVIESVIGNGFSAIKGITTFAPFPSCGQSWNHYLLESYVYMYSKKYRLHCMNFNDKNAGIIGSRTLGLSYDEMLVEAAAKSNVPLTAESIGQYFFETGLTAKRKYASLPDVIEKARDLREEG